jgi:4-hydroxy-tetrahydrodipicolinate synthase
MKLNDVTLWTAIVTPLNSDEQVDFESLESLTKKQAAAHNGVVLLGSTGESLNLSMKDKKAIVENYFKSNPTCPTIIGVGGADLDSTLDWLSFCEKFPFDGYLMVTPFYSKPGIIGQTVWFETLMNAVTKPCMLYNVPGRTAIALHPETLKRVKDHPHFWALKESSGSVDKFCQYKEIIPNHKIFCGDDALLPFFASIGCDGLVSVAANAWPQETNYYTELCLNKKAELTFPLWEKATSSLFLASNPIPVKSLLHLKGWIKTPIMVAPLHHEDFKQMETVNMYDIKIKEWFEGTKNGR